MCRLVDLGQHRVVLILRKALSCADEVLALVQAIVEVVHQACQLIECCRYSVRVCGSLGSRCFERANR